MIIEDRLRFNKVVNLGLCGDTGYLNKDNAQNSKLLKKYYQKGELDYMVLLGDNFYPNGVENVKDPQFITKFKDIFPPIVSFVILGNHDYLSNPIAQLNPNQDVNQSHPVKHWYMPNFFYDVIIKIGTETVHLIFIDACILGNDITQRLLNSSQNKYNFNIILRENYIPQLNWLNHILSHSQSKWKIMFGHYPIFSNGPHQTSLNLNTILLPLLQRYNVDCYVSGHDHNLQHIEKDGIHFVVSGSFSDTYSSENRYPNSFKCVQNGFVILSMDENKLIFKFINSSNEVVHSFQIIK
jgi:acid phosphatase